MKPSILNKLENLSERFDEIAQLLADPDTINDQPLFRKLSVEYSQLEPVTHHFRQWQQALEDQESAQAMLSDPEMKEMAQEEIQATQETLEALELTLQKLLLPKDPNDERNIFLEIRAGTGGDEAAIFAGDLFRMYARFAELNRWQVEIISAHEGEHGGFKEIICKVSD